MDGRFEEFFEKLSERFLTGPLDWIEDVYLYPLSVFKGGNIHIERGPDDTRDYLTKRRETAARAGIATMRAAQVRPRQTQEGRWEVAVVMEFFSTSGKSLGSNRSRYLCREDEAGEIRIESVEILDSGLPTDRH